MNRKNKNKRTCAAILSFALLLGAFSQHLTGGVWAQLDDSSEVANEESSSPVYGEGQNDTTTDTTTEVTTETASELSTETIDTETVSGPLAVVEEETLEDEMDTSSEDSENEVNFELSGDETGLGLGATVIVGETTYTLDTVADLINADLALLKWQSMGSNRTGAVSGTFYTVAGEAGDKTQYDYSGYDAVYDCVYQMLIANHTDEFTNGAKLIPAAKTYSSGDMIWLLHDTVTLDYIMTINGTARIILVTDNSQGCTVTCTRNGTGTASNTKDTTGRFQIDGNRGASLTVQGRDADCTIDFDGGATIRWNDATKIVSVNQDRYAFINITGNSFYCTFMKIQNFGFSRTNGGADSATAIIMNSNDNDYAEYAYISNLTIQNCAGGYTAGILMRTQSGKLTNVQNSIMYVYDSIFQNCYSDGDKDAGGGAIRSFTSSRAKLYLENCSFLNNANAKTGATKAAGGGAIRWHASCTSQNEDGSMTSCWIKNCEFTGNYSWGTGGAIYNGSGMSLEGCTFTNNKADQGGGAICTTAVVVDSTNDSIPMDGKFYADLSLDSSTEITGNESATKGGGILFNIVEGKNGTSKTDPKYTFQNYTFNIEINGAAIQNNSAKNGGAIAVDIAYDYPCSVTINSGTIQNNTATENGGAVWIGYSNKCACTKSKGITLNDGLIVNNTAAGNGGAFYMDLPATAGGGFTMTGGTMQYNAASQDGGGAYVSGGSFYKSGGTLQYNTAADNGGGAYVSGGNIIESGGSIENCTAQNGGGVYLTGGTFVLTGTGTVENCRAVLDENDTSGSTGRGGAVYIGGGRAVIGVDRELKDGHTLEKLYTTEETSESISCKITGCEAVNGGAIYVSGDDGNGNSVVSSVDETTNLTNEQVNPQNYNVYFSEGSIEGNTADQNGGAICVNNGHILMDGGTLDSNTAANGNGGAIYLSSQARADARVRIRSGSITNNTADQNGGAIAVEGKGSDNTQEDDVTLKLTIGVNTSHSDGDCDHINDEDWNDDACPILTQNSSKISGGGIYINGGSSTYLNIYCITESGNYTVEDKDDRNVLSDFMKVIGGSVTISSGEKVESQGNDGNVVYNHTNGDGTNGNVNISDSIFVNGGTLDLYGHMDNPDITAVITVDVEEHSGAFTDHRIQTTEEQAVYWVHYYENFKESDDAEPTGRYKAYSVEAVTSENGTKTYTHAILSSLFYRPGWTIVGWNTAKDGSGNEYEVSSSYDFPEVQTHEENGEQVSDLIANEGGTELTTLIIYAVWSKDHYTIQYDANISDYTGTMDNQICEVGVETQLNENAFASGGKDFVSWNTKKDGTGTSYENQANVKDLVAKDGGSITLYAQWKEHVHQLIYTVVLVPGGSGGDSGNEGETGGSGGSTIQETCSGCTHTACVTIQGFSVPYDEKTHEATIKYSGNTWLGNTPAVSYVMQADAKWDASQTSKGDGIDTAWSSDKNPKPLHAGAYTATLSVTYDITTADENGKQSAATSETKTDVTCTITRIKWDTPDVPSLSSTEISADPGTENKITIQPRKTGDGYVYQYFMSTEKISTASEVTWKETATFSVVKSYGNGYYFYIMQKEDRDHEDSDPSSAFLYITTNGNLLSIEAEDGITYELKNPESGDTGTPSFSASAEEGYHLRNFDGSMEKTVLDKDGNENTEGLAYISLNKLESSDSNPKYEISGLSKVSNSLVTIYLSGVAKDASVTAARIYGQEFDSFKDTQTTISCDSAFTANFVVRDYIPEEYETPSLIFDQTLPTNTTIILKDMAGGTYWYYIVGGTGESTKTIGTDSQTEIELTNFNPMGKTADGTSPVSYDDEEKESPQNMEYQFIVDFSQVDESSRLTAEDVKLNLVLTPKETVEKGNISWTNQAPAIGNSFDTPQVSIGLASVAEFEMSVESTEKESSAGQETTDDKAANPAPSDQTETEAQIVSGKTAVLQLTYTPSTGSASIWEDRDMALVLTAADDIPADLYLSVKVGSRTSRYYQNQEKQFIISLSELNLQSSATWTKEVEVTLCSDLFGETAENYAFDVQWLVSDSEAERAPLNGYEAAYRKVEFQDVMTNIVSVRIDDTKTNHMELKQSRVLTIDDDLCVYIRYNNVEESAEVTARIERENDNGEYVATAQTVKLTAESSSILKAALKGQLTGNFRLVVEVKKDYKVLAEDNYYFIIHTHL